MGLDLEQIMILLQRRYTALREIKRLTEELNDTVSREDEVSASLLLQMRADEMERVDESQEQIWEMAKAGPEEYEEIRRLMSQEFLKASAGKTPKENQILTLRKKTAELIEEVQRMDKAFNLRAAGARSYYSSNR